VEGGFGCEKRERKKNGLIMFIPPETFKTLTKSSPRPVHPSRAFVSFKMTSVEMDALSIIISDRKFSSQRGCRMVWDS